MWKTFVGRLVFEGTDSLVICCRVVAFYDLMSWLNECMDVSARTCPPMFELGDEG